VAACPLVAVTLNWNRAADTLACLRSLRAAGLPPEQVVVVDNGSTDDSVAVLRAACPEARLLVNPRNMGFAGGANPGLARALEMGQPYILLLNNDTEVAADSLEILVAAAEEHPRAGILSPLIRYAGDGRVWFAGSYRRRFLPGAFWPAYRRRRSLPPAARAIDYATGCAMLLRSTMLHQVGLFDETYFMYWEDLDLCERARRTGWQILLIPPAVVHHRVSASIGEESPAKWRYMGRYVPTFYRRYYRRPRLAMLAYTAWVAARETLRGNGGVVGPFLDGFREGWRADWP
jgi:hypothetical protein